jgi:hypothetical protein
MYLFAGCTKAILPFPNSVLRQKKGPCSTVSLGHFLYVHGPPVSGHPLKNAFCCNNRVIQQVPFSKFRVENDLLRIVERAARQPSHLWANTVFLLCVTGQSHTKDYMLAWALVDVPAG